MKPSAEGFNESQRLRCTLKTEHHENYDANYEKATVKEKTIRVIIRVKTITIKLVEKKLL